MGRLARPIHLKTTVGVVLAAEKGGSGVASGRALRHYLHAIHACPTASAAWLNASEVSCGQHCRSEPRSEPRIGRNVFTNSRGLIFTSREIK